jgi:conjugative transfer protein CagX
MKHAWIFVLAFCIVCSFADEPKPESAEPEVIHLATALDHLTVLEFGEPVTMAAAGSTAFQIERHDDKVFIKPLKTGASTDLFVWTASRRFTYELEAPGEVTKMNFAIESRISAPKPVPDSSAHLEEVADMVLTRAFLGAERVDSSNIRDQKDGITVRVEHVFQSRNTTYIHYVIRNSSGRPYRIPIPSIEQVLPLQASISVSALKLQQLNPATAARLGKREQSPLDIAHTETQRQDLASGEETQGVIAIRQKIESPAVIKIGFGSDRKNPIEAILVL